MSAFATPRTSPPSGRLDSVQVLRAVAVMIVALYHATVLFRDPLAARWAIPNPLYFGYAGVDLFFVISGFIILHVTRKGDMDVREFLLKRVFRILPFYWAVTTLLLLIWLAKPALVPVRSDQPGLFMLGSYLLAPMRERPLLGVGWTLQHEAQFYILMALLLLAGARNFAVPVLLALFAVGVALRVVVDPGQVWWDGKIFSLYTLEFALGALAWQINARWSLARPWLLIAIGTVGYLVTAATVTPLMGPDREVPVVTRGLFGLYRTLGYGGSAFLIILGALNLESVARPGAIKRAALAVGDASFVIYLLHNLVLQGLAMVTRHLPQTAATAIVAVVGAMVVVMVVGVVLHHLVERPLLRFFEQSVMPRLLGHRVETLTVAAQRDVA